MKARDPLAFRERVPSRCHWPNTSMIRLKSGGAVDVSLGPDAKFFVYSVVR